MNSDTAYDDSKSSKERLSIRQSVSDTLRKGMSREDSYAKTSLERLSVSKSGSNKLAGASASAEGSEETLPFREPESDDLDETLRSSSMADEDSLRTRGQEFDFEKLGKALVSDSVDDSDNYAKVRRGDMPPIGKSDFTKAKAFLSVVHPRLNISLYDHLADLMKKILRSKIPDAVDKLEELSQEVKKMRQKPEEELLEIFEISEELQVFMREKRIFYKFKAPTPAAEETLRTAEEDESDEEEEEEEEEEEAEGEEEEEEEPAEAESSETIKAPDLCDVLPDVPYVMGRFNEAGIGMSALEVFELAIALKDLVVQFKLGKVRFWGKVFGMKNDYYVAEAPYQEDVPQETYGWSIPEESKEKETEEKEGEKGEEEAEEEEKEGVEEDKDEAEEGKEGEEKEAVTIPPVPEPLQKVKKTIPAEKNGTGVNEYLYFVCTNFGQPWRVLPYMLPSHISEARYLKRFFTGDLEAEIRGCVPYPGKEAYFLRAQIARITATTYIAPSGYYKKAGEKSEDDDEEDEAEEEAEEKKDNVVLNPKFEPRATKYIHSEGLKGWFHYRKAILYQGRCTPMKAKEGDEEEEDEDKSEDEEKEEEEKEAEPPEILEAIVETEVPILREISEDRAVGRLIPWTLKLSSKLVEEKAVLIVRSNLWPGAYTFYDGKSFDHIYIGHGIKYTVLHYAPPVRPEWQLEHEVGDDLLEDIDEEILPKEETEGDEEEAEDQEKQDDIEEEDEGGEEEEEEETEAD